MTAFAGESRRRIIATGVDLCHLADVTHSCRDAGRKGAPERSTETGGGAPNSQLLDEREDGDGTLNRSATALTSSARIVTDYGRDSDHMRK